MFGTKTQQDTFQGEVCLSDTKMATRVEKIEIEAWLKEKNLSELIPKFKQKNVKMEELYDFAEDRLEFRKIYLSQYRSSHIIKTLQQICLFQKIWC